MTPQRFSVPSTVLSALADGGGGAAGIRLLVRARRSRTLLLLSHTVREAESTGHPQAAVAGAAARALAALAPRAVDAVLDHPSVGAWAQHQALLLRQSPEKARPGGLAAVAVAAAVRARTPLVLPVAAGPEFAVPSLGWADLGAGAEVAVRPGPGCVELCRGGDRAVVPDDPSAAGERWHGLPRIEVGTAAFTVDTWRHIHLPAGLRAAVADTWSPSEWCDRLGASWDILTARHPGVAEELAVGLSALTPLRPGAGPTSVTLAAGFGCVFLSLPPDDRAAAETLTHEWHHAKLSVVMDLFPLLARDPAELFYAPWRPDPRPLVGVLHGTYAHLGVTAFWRRERGTGASRADVEFARWRAVTLSAADSLLHGDCLTDTGHRFVSRIAARLRGWADEPVPADAARIARAQAGEHRTAWLAANQREDRS